MWDWIKNKWMAIRKYVLYIAIGLACVVLLGIFVPSTRPAITWALGAIRTIVEILFWLLSLPYKLIG